MDPTQAFGLESSGDEKSEQSSRGVSFQLGLSESSHLQDQARALAMESTQAFVSVECTQVYAAISHADRAFSENDLNLEATQAYGEDEEPTRCSVMSEGEGQEGQIQVDLAQEATQAYISDPYCDSEDGADDHEEKNSATTETQPYDFPTSATLAMAETQPMSAFEEEDSLDKQNPVSSVLQFESRPKNETEDRKEHGEAVKPQERPLTESQLVAETQPMCASHEESSDEDSIPGPRKRKATPLPLEEEQTQPFTSCELSLVETQPMHISVVETMATSGNEDSDKDDSIPRLQKRKRKQPEEKAQFLISSELSDLETQPMVMGKDRESDDEDSIPCFRKRKAKVLELEEEETQTLTSSKVSAVETQPMVARQQKSDEEDEDIHAQNVSLIKEKEERLGEREDFTKLRQQEREEEKKIEKERKEKEEQERIQAENSERPRLECEKTERETIESERKNQEEKQKVERTQKGAEQLENEDKERLECEKTEREEKERLESEDKVRIENERKDRDAKDRLETERRELEDKLERKRKEQEHQASSETKGWEGGENSERIKQEQEAKEKAIKEQQENKPKVPTRGRRAARRTAALCTTEQEQDSTISTNDDVPARRTRSHSNSSNSVSSERSASRVNTQESKGRGRGRGAKRTSEPPRTVISRSSNRRKTVAAKPTEQDSRNISQGVLSRSNCSNFIDSEISSCRLSSQGRVRGGRQCERGRKAEADSIPPINSQNDHNSAPKSRTRSMKCSGAVESSNTVHPGDGKEKADSQQARTTRGRWRSSSNVSKPADDKDPSNEEERCANEESLPLKRNVRARGLKAVKNEAVEASVTPAVSNGNEAEEKRKGRKRVSEANMEEDSSSSSRISKGKEKEQITEAVEEAKGQRKEEIPVQAKRKGRTSIARTKKDAIDSPTEVEVKGDSGKKEAEAIEKRGRGRPLAVQKKKKEEQEEIGTSVKPDAHVVESEVTWVLHSQTCIANF